MIESTDVIVVGAGPVGLLAAIELTLGGARTVVLERLHAPSTALKALAIGPLGSEALQRRGMGAAIAAAEARNLAAMGQAGAAMRARSPRISGHFAGLFLLRQNAQVHGDRGMRIVDQQGLEAMLGARADELGIVVRRGCAVTGLVPGLDGVVVELLSPAGQERLACSWLVGCDGGRSAVRKTAGFAFPGTPPTMTMYHASVGIDHPDRLMPQGWRHTPTGVFAYGPFPDRLFMLDFSGPPADRQAPVTREEIEGALRRISGADVRVTRLGAANRWTDNTRLVDTYRRGRILLAGDAAHVHSPFGGQGLSLGLSDAANLGWKLAAVVRGEMRDDLLDTYTAERRPVAEAVLANTLAQAAIMRPDPQSSAMRALMAKLLEFDDVNRLVGGMTSGLAVRYDLGSDRDEVGRLLGDRHLGERSLYDLMQDGRGVLLDATPDAAASTRVGTHARVRCMAVEPGPSMLIRPDGCVAWAGDGGDLDGLDRALDRWFEHQRLAA